MARPRSPLKLIGGFTLLIGGVLMLVLPGPGWVTIALGLAMLAKEYAWARYLLAKLKKTAKVLVAKAGGPPRPT